MRATSGANEIRIRVAKHDELKENGRRMREINLLNEKRYNLNDEDNKIEITMRPLGYDRVLNVTANVETSNTNFYLEPTKAKLSRLCKITSKFTS